MLYIISSFITFRRTFACESCMYAKYKQTKPNCINQYMCLSVCVSRRACAYYCLSVFVCLSSVCLSVFLCLSEWQSVHPCVCVRERVCGRARVYVHQKAEKNMKHTVVLYPLKYTFSFQFKRLSEGHQPIQLSTTLVFTSSDIAPRT